MKDCPFCDEARYHTASSSVATILDNYPVTVGHTLVVPVQHWDDYIWMPFKEQMELWLTVTDVCEELLCQDKSIKGFNIGINCGAAAGQTVQHAHIHVIPRRHGDVDNPRGGVRHVIPGKGDYQ